MDPRFCEQGRQNSARLRSGRRLSLGARPTGKIRHEAGSEIMSSQLTEEELAALMPSELCTYQTPIPTQIVASDEFYPDPQNERQREVEARLLAMATISAASRA
jgi:hypothetical protein